MRTTHLARLPRHKTHAVRHYPTRSDGHPLYLFGHFDLDGQAPAGCFELDETILGIKEDPQLAGFAGPMHGPFHVVTAAPESQRFMFGVDREQPQVGAQGEPMFYFWAAEGRGPDEPAAML